MCQNKTQRTTAHIKESTHCAIQMDDSMDEASHGILVVRSTMCVGWRFTRTEILLNATNAQGMFNTVDQYLSSVSLTCDMSQNYNRWHCCLERKTFKICEILCGIIVFCTKSLQDPKYIMKLIKQLCNDRTEHGQVLYYAQVFWLSRQKVHSLFYELRVDFTTFLLENKVGIL